MYPYIKDGELLIFYRLNKEYHNNDIIISNNKIYRIIGINNDKIDINNNELTINDYKEEDKLYFSTIKNSESFINYPLILKKDEFFVLNDYRDDLNDSRTFGTIKKKDISGLLILSIQIRDF